MAFGAGEQVACAEQVLPALVWTLFGSCPGASGGRMAPLGLALPTVPKVQASLYQNFSFDRDSTKVTKLANG